MLLIRFQHNISLKLTELTKIKNVIANNILLLLISIETMLPIIKTKPKITIVNKISEKFIVYIYTAMSRICFVY